MDPYSSPKSNLELSAGEIAKSIVKTVLVFFTGLIVMYFAAYELAGVFARQMLSVFNTSEVSHRLIFDAFATFILESLIFIVLLRITNIYNGIVIFLIALAMFMNWGLDNYEFSSGISTWRPLWYQINMAINDFVAALVAWIIHRRITRPSTTFADW